MINADDIKNNICMKIKEFYNQETVNDYKTMDDDEIITSFLDMRNKRIETKPRKVLISEELKNKMENDVETKKYKDDILVFKTKFEKGDNINGHLSRNIYISQQYDRLLNCWDMHHLHLNKHKADNNNEMQDNRSEQYLLFLVDEDTAYFVDSVKHLSGDEFANVDFLNIIYKNGWIEKAGLREGDIISPNQAIWNKEDIYQLWKGGITPIFFEFEGKYYISSRGVTLGGNSIESSSERGKLNRFLYEVTNKYTIETCDIKIVKEKDIPIIEISLGYKQQDEIKTIQINF